MTSLALLQTQGSGRDAAGAAEGQGSEQQPQQRRPQEPVGQAQHNKAAVKQKLLERLADDVSKLACPLTLTSLLPVCVVLTRCDAHHRPPDSRQCHVGLLASQGLLAKSACAVQLSKQVAASTSVSSYQLSLIQPGIDVLYVCNHLHQVAGTSLMHTTSAALCKDECTVTCASMHSSGQPCCSAEACNITLLQSVVLLLLQGGRDRGRGRGRGRGRQGRRGYDDEEESGMTLDEYEAMQRRPKSATSPAAPAQPIGKPASVLLLNAVVTVQHRQPMSCMTL